MTAAVIGLMPVAVAVGGARWFQAWAARADARGLNVEPVTKEDTPCP